MIDIEEKCFFYVLAQTLDGPEQKIIDSLPLYSNFQNGIDQVYFPTGVEGSGTGSH